MYIIHKKEMGARNCNIDVEVNAEVSVPREEFVKSLSFFQVMKNIHTTRILKVYHY